MLTHIAIKNYRGLRDLEIAKLGRINLISGQNNSGKTSLLEALFAWSGAGNPEIIMNTNIMRGLEQFNSPPDPDVLTSTLWYPFFSSLDPDQIIEVEAHHARFGGSVLSISVENPDRVELSVSPIGENISLKSLVTRFGGDDSSMFEGRISFAGGNIQMERSREPKIIVPATILTARARHNEADAVRLGQLRRQKLSHHVLEAVRAIDSRILSIEDSVASGTPLIWIDIGLDEFIPLPAAGDGLCRVVSLLLAIANSKGGIVLADEIENGLHHSVLKNVWSAVERSAEYFDTQVFATTHSFECLKAAYESLSGDTFLMHRLETTRERSSCTTYEPEEFASAMRHDFEVR